MSRYIDADAYAAEMKTRQDACKEIMDAAKEDDNWELYDRMGAEFSIFIEAKLTLDAMPTVDAVPVVLCGECIHRYVDGENVRFNVCELNHNKVQADDWFCADGERKDGETEQCNTYSLGKIEMPKGAIEQIIADGERKEQTDYDA